MFGMKKKEKPIKVQFYEGNLKGFICNHPCQITLGSDNLKITRVKPDVQVTLDRSRILSIETFTEKEYMAKYKHNAGTTSKCDLINKYYYLLRYESKSGDTEQLVFWGTGSEILGMHNMQKDILLEKQPDNYEL